MEMKTPEPISRSEQWQVQLQSVIESIHVSMWTAKFARVVFDTLCAVPGVREITFSTQDATDIVIISVRYFDSALVCYTIDDSGVEFEMV